MVKILADECIHQDLAKALRDAGFNVLTTREANLKGVSDDSIFNSAAKTKRTLLTFDRGFGNFFRFNFKKSAGVVIVLIDKMEKKEIIRYTINFFMAMKDKDLKRKLVIIDKSKARIRSF